MAFDFGTKVATPSSSFKNPEVGQHAARLRSIVHMGMIINTYQGKAKPAAPYVAAIFELKEDTDRTDDGVPLTITKEFPLLRSDNAFMTSFMKGMLTTEEFNQYKAGTLNLGFDDLIGRTCQLDLTGSKELDESGKPRYVNVGTIAQLHPKLAAFCDELEVQGVGHMPMDKMTVEGIRELSKYTVSTKVMQGLTYAGSKAEEAVTAILAEDPMAFTMKKAVAPKPAPVAAVDMDEDKEF